MSGRVGWFEPGDFIVIGKRISRSGSRAGLLGILVKQEVIFQNQFDIGSGAGCP